MHYLHSEPGATQIKGSDPAPVAAVTTTDWRQSLPILAGGGVTLRELRLSDAASLVALLSTAELSRFISPPPSTVDGFERFILWAQRERAAGRFVCFGVVPEGSDAAIGLFQLRAMEPTLDTVEWGFALGSSFWGTGVFVAAAKLVADFAFDGVGVRRLEARASVQNARGNGALNKLGANRECMLPRSFLREDEYLDQVLWTILAEDWRRARASGPIAPTIAPGTVIH
jgi:RimJ/RimL family protein N-acetyltransferase